MFNSESESCFGKGSRKNYLGQLTQMWVGGVGWSQTFIIQCLIGIFDGFPNEMIGRFR